MAKAEVVETGVLLDAATIRAVGRILGVTVVADRAGLEADLSAYEQFITSVLFFDKICVLEDGRAQKILHAVFGATLPEFISVIPMSREDIEQCSKYSVELMSEDFLQLEWRKDSSDLMRRFLHHMDAHISVSWNTASKMTGLLAQLWGSAGYASAKENPLLAAVLYSRPDGKNDHFSLQREIDNVALKSNGHGESIVVTPNLIEVCRSLNWLLFRTAIIHLSPMPQVFTMRRTRAVVCILLISWHTEFTCRSPFGSPFKPVSAPRRRRCRRTSVGAPAQALSMWTYRFSRHGSRPAARRRERW